MVVVRVRLDLPHFIDSKADVGDIALVLRLTADIEFTDLRHHRRIGRQVMLDADHQIAASSKQVCQKRVLGEFNGIAVIDDRHGQFDQAGIGLQFLVAPNGYIDSDQTVIARRICEGEHLVPDRPLARREIAGRNKYAKRK